METSAEKILKPKKHPAGKAKSGGQRVRIEWEETPELVWLTGGKIRSDKRKTGLATSENPFLGKCFPFSIPAKTIGKAILDPKGDYIVKGEVEKPKYWRPTCPIMTWETKELPKNIEKF